MARSKTPDQLAKALHPYLSSKTSPSELKSLGWFDFLDQDRPGTQDAVEMASSAFCI